jgi:hypothetical protein
MQLCGLLESALGSIRYALKIKRDAKLAHRILVDLGVIWK